MRKVLLIAMGIFCCANDLYAAWPGACTIVAHVANCSSPNSGNYSLGTGVTYNPSTGSFSGYTYKTEYLTNPNVCSVTWASYYKESEGTTWVLKSQSTAVLHHPYPPDLLDSIRVTSLSPLTLNSLYPTCSSVPHCRDKRGQSIDSSDSYPIYTGLPYHAQYYQTVGLCVNGCKAVPSGPVILDQYASDGSGYTVGPWSYTGDECVPSVTPSPPPQPSPEELCENQKNACAAKCSGKAYSVDCNAGSCECFGAPSYNTDPPLEPTTPEENPSAPPVPANQTPQSDPGGDAQLGAQINNQAKQIDQGNAQLGQLGAVNSKLGAVIGNQAKQIGQGDKMLDYQRQQLGATKDGNSTLKDIDDKLDEMLTSDVPSLPSHNEIDGSLGDEKDWNQYDNIDQVGEDKANRAIAIAEKQDLQSPLNFNITTTGSSPVLSGQMMGRTVEIRFDRPWMETGYSIMHAIFIGIGYLQAFLMINSTFTKR